MQVITVARCRWIPTEVHPSKGGELFAVENLKSIPFVIQKMIVIKAAQGSVRGEHAHRRLEQVWYCLSGSCKFLLDDGKTQETVELNASRQGLYMGRYVWHRMFDFSANCILIALGSDLHDPDEYILDHSDFLNALSDGNPLL